MKNIKKEIYHTLKEVIDNVYQEQPQQVLERPLIIYKADSRQLYSFDGPTHKEVLLEIEIITDTQMEQAEIEDKITLLLFNKGYLKRGTSISLPTPAYYRTVHRYESKTK